MAGDWIKVEKSTARKPEIFGVASKLGVSLDAAFGMCVRFWMWCDDQMIDGNARSVTPALLDDSMGSRGFADALISVGWLQVRSGSLVVPNFDRHLSESSKKRALTGKRVAKTRSQERNKCNAGSVTEALPEREKRREDKQIQESLKKDSCPEVPLEPSEPSVMEFPTVGKISIWGLTQSKVDEYAATYPSLDVLQECRKARQWSIDNPTNRKTHGGMTKFLNGWMARAQNSGRSNGQRTASNGQSAEQGRFYETLNVLEEFAAGDADRVRQVNRPPLRLEENR